MIALSFDRPGELKKAVTNPEGEWIGQIASQSPLNDFEIVIDGSGAEGTPGYLALYGQDSNQFYVESTPYWWTPSQTFDLRDTYATLYLKEIRPISVASGYQLCLFIDDYVPGSEYCGWYLNAPLNVGKGEWAFNRLELVNDERLWVRYSNDRSLDQVLSQVGFIGIAYRKGTTGFGVRANGVLGLDEFKYDLRQ